jgi:hypothetical protein
MIPKRDKLFRTTREHPQRGAMKGPPRVDASLRWWAQQPKGPVPWLKMPVTDQRPLRADRVVLRADDRF